MRTKDNDEEILYTTESKEDAITKGGEIANQLARSAGLISLERMEFDEENNRIGSKCELYKTW